MLKTAVMYVVYLAEGLAIVFILFGIVGALVIYATRTRFVRTDYRAFVEGRHHLGHCLSLSLEFLIGADILKTAISPTWQDIGQLAAIVGIRTVLNYFLTRELQQMSAMRGRRTPRHRRLRPLSNISKYIQGGMDESRRL